MIKSTLRFEREPDSYIDTLTGDRQVALLPYPDGTDYMRVDYSDTSSKVKESKESEELQWYKYVTNLPSSKKQSYTQHSDITLDMLE